MNRILASTAAVVLLMAGAVSIDARAQGAPQTPAPAQVAGEWTVTLQTRQEAQFRGAIAQTGTTLKGYMGDEIAEYPLTGTVSGNDVKLMWQLEQFGQKIPITFSAKFDKEQLTGRAVVGTLDEVEAFGQRTAK